MGVLSKIRRVKIILAGNSYEWPIGSKHEAADRAGIVKERLTPQAPRPSRRLQNYCFQEE